MKKNFAFFPFAFLALFYFYPLVVIFITSFVSRRTGRMDFSGAMQLVADPHFARVLWFTIWQAALSTLLTLMVALPAAYAFARFRFPGKNILRALTTIPFLMPTVVVAAAFSTLLGPRGWINNLLINLFHLDAPPIQLLNTVWVILLAHVFYNFTVVLRIVGGFWTNLDPQYGQAARVLGADRLRAFREITLPLLAPSIIAAALLIFIFDFTSFGVVLILGGPRLSTLEVEIYRQTVNIFNLPLAAILSFLQMLCTFSLMLIYTRAQSSLARPIRLRPTESIQRDPRTPGEKIFLAAVLFSMLFLLGAPLATLTLESFITEGGLGLQNYFNLFQNPRGSITFVPPIEAVRNSLLFAVAVAVLALPIGLSAAYSLARNSRGAISRLADAVYMLPLGTSSVTLGFGYLIALDRPPLELRATVFLVPIAHALIAFPFIVRSLLPILRGIKMQLREGARVLGASPARVWREIDLPIIARALTVGAVFAFVISLGEFGATALIVLPEYPTIPIAIFRLLGEPGIANYGQAIALSVILMVVSAAAIFAMERARVGEIGEF
jgi:thiamine transport system permease protein